MCRSCTIKVVYALHGEDVHMDECGLKVARQNTRKHPYTLYD